LYGSNECRSIKININIIANECTLTILHFIYDVSNFLLSKAIVPTDLKGTIPILQFTQIPALAIASLANTVLNVGFATPII
jgi:hypothetical protein